MQTIELFCGAGGMSEGLKKADIYVNVAVDSCGVALKTYKRNHPTTRTIEANILDVEPEQLSNGERPLLLVACPPCQTFSKLNRNRGEIENAAFNKFLEFIRALDPDFLLFENVPNIERYGVWSDFMRVLQNLHYHEWHSVVEATSFGVAQRRKRMVLVASKRPFTQPTLPLVHVLPTVRQTIGDLPFEHSDIPNHVTSNMTEVNLLRLHQLKEGEGSRSSGSPYSDKYARMSWDKPAPTITTHCTTFSCGRFGHPSYDRAITVREAARLQGFDDDFVFEGTLTQTAKQVGNAIPPPIAQWLGGIINNLV
jgi:DNA (cytosine-5)-methyltransferase 1